MIIKMTERAIKKYNKQSSDNYHVKKKKGNKKQPTVL
jgi:hypothetical protein